MTKRKVYAKPCIAVEDFVLNQFIAGPCQVSVRKVKFSDVPLYKDMLGAGYFAAGVQPNCALYLSQYDDSLCYHTQGGARGVLINS